MEIKHENDNFYEVAEFLDACWREAYAGIIDSGYLAKMSVSAREERLQARYDSGQSEVLTMRDGDVLAGACVYGKSFTDGYPDDGEISAIYLRRDYIGRGHGHRLLVELERLLAEKGYTCLVLDVLSENKEAVAFYHAHGYRIVKDTTINVGDVDYPLVVFRKKAG
jgi:ribosomal protein S18 acetylase RimI-like enzyme